MISKQELTDQLRDDRSKTNRAHGDGAWDVADVMAIVWPKIEHHKAMHVVLDVVNLPFVSLSTYEDKRKGTGYAAVMKDVRYGMNSWCHDVDETDPPFFYHKTETDAWECFDKNHPGLRSSIELLEATRNDST